MSAIQEDSNEPNTSIISVKNLTFSYAWRDSLQRTHSLYDVSIDIPRGARVLVIGANGSGKSTLLRIIGGRHLVSSESCTVLGRSAFHDTTLLSDVVYLGDWWRRDYIGIPVKEVLAVHLNNPACKDRVMYLANLFEVELHWPVSMLSDGERRRVQIVAGLAVPKQLYLLDEITAELDLLSRVNLLRFLRDETARTGATVLLATHIFDDVAFLNPSLVIRAKGGQVAVYDAERLASTAAAGTDTNAAIVCGSIHPPSSPSRPAQSAHGDDGLAAPSPASPSPQGDADMTPHTSSDATAAAAAAGVAAIGGGGAGEAAGVAAREAWYRVARGWLTEDHNETRAAKAGVPWQLRDVDLKVK